MFCSLLNLYFGFSILKKKKISLHPRAELYIFSKFFLKLFPKLNSWFSPDLIAL